VVHVLLIRERGLSSDDAWYPWLKRECEKREISFVSGDFPDSNNLLEWQKKVGEHLKFLDGSSMIIGHGFGAEVALKVLENKSRTIAAAFLVGGKLGDEQYDFANIKTKAREFFVYASDDDEVVSAADTEHLAEMLDESVLHIQEAGHFDKIAEFEDILIDIISVLDS
jgi:predicted alpha/beta hydrolase family esterase